MASTLAAAQLWLALDLDGPESVPEAIAAEAGGTWTPFHADLTQTALQVAHRLGLLVIPWTVNEPAEMASLLAVGVDRLISDYPDRVLHQLG